MRFGTDSTREQFGKEGWNNPVIKNMDNKTCLRDNAGIDDDVEISDIRDGAYTAAVESGADITLAKPLRAHVT